MRVNERDSASVTISKGLPSRDHGRVWVQFHLPSEVNPVTKKAYVLSYGGTRCRNRWLRATAVMRPFTWDASSGQSQSMSRVIDLFLVANQRHGQSDGV